MSGILFLDIDGVLNRDSTEELCDGCIGVDRELSRRLLDWLKTTNVKIVLSSTWRNHPEMHEHLHEAGIHWIGITPVRGTIRGDEIEAWLEDNREDWERYAILDDNSDMLASQRPFFVQTNTYVGLKPEHIDRLNEIFKADSKRLAA